MKHSLSRLSGATKVWLFFLSITIVFLIIGNSLSGRIGLFISFIFALIFHSLVYFYGRSRLIHYFHARPIFGNDPWGLTQYLKKYSLLLQIPKPDLYVIDSQSCIAFSIGNYWQNSSICISTGLLKKLSEKETETVLVHQICHVHRMNTFEFGVAHIISFSLVGLGQLLDYFWPFKKHQKVILQKPFSNLLSPLAWFILKLAITDKIYFQNDDMAAALLHDRKSLAEVLWKLDGLNQSYPLQLPPCSSHFFIVNPTALKETNWFLLAHPKIDTRIRRLIGYFPI